VGIRSAEPRRARRDFIEQHGPAAASFVVILIRFAIGGEAEILGLDVFADQTLEVRPRACRIHFPRSAYAADDESKNVIEYLGQVVLVGARGRVIAETICGNVPCRTTGDLERIRVIEQGDAALSFYRLALALKLFGSTSYPSEADFVIRLRHLQMANRSFTKK